MKFAGKKAISFGCSRLPTNLQDQLNDDIVTATLNEYMRVDCRCSKVVVEPSYC